MQPAPTAPDGLEDLVRRLRGRRVVALTGAGISTESGIPDYRGEGTRQRARRPIQFREFMGEGETRQRYWARSAVGWPRFQSARPNRGHHALAALERAGALAGIITQNVDRLHHRAGSRRIVELHGALAEVRCLVCDQLEDRDALQDRLATDNPALTRVSAAPAPDGDAHLPTELVAGFRVPACLACGGVLKPNVVFFGENVPRDVTAAAWALFDEAEVLLVIGSSLAVFSGFRFVRRAAERGVPIAIVNRGACRGAELAAVMLDAPAGDTLARVADHLTG